jgi:hypothetical protein
MVAAMQEAVKARPQRVVQVPTLTMGTVQEQQKAIQVISLALSMDGLAASMCACGTHDQ